MTMHENIPGAYCEVIPAPKEIWEIIKRVQEHDTMILQALQAPKMIVHPTKEQP